MISFQVSALVLEITNAKIRSVEKGLKVFY